MQYSFYILFLIFFIYSIVGYLIESTYVSFIKKEVTFSRGFLIGPYLPIFGFGGLFLTTVLSKYNDDLLVLFTMSTVSCLILEYISSYVLEKLFNLRWWDYSNKPFNLNGRICLGHGVMFGLIGVIANRLINPIVVKFISIFSNKSLIIISIICLLILLTDLYISRKIVIKFGQNFNKYSKDSTYEVKAKIIEELSNNSFLIKRLLKAFPNAKDKLNKYRELREQYYKKLKNKYKNTK